MAGWDWLDLKTATYQRWVETWKLNENRMRGGQDVLCELKRFDWELPSGLPEYMNAQFDIGTGAGRDAKAVGLLKHDELNHYQRRQREATYPNYPDQLAKGLVGFLQRVTPQPGQGLNFGRLGEVRRATEGAQPTMAELVYFNADGVGNAESQWDNFWAGAMQRAMATGLRWIFVDAPQVKDSSRTISLADVLAGQRPYLVEFSPVSVPFWIFEDGKLQAAIVRICKPTIVQKGDSFEIDDTPMYLLLVRKGYAAFGATYEPGGWWIFDKDKQPTAQTGNWDSTGGEIPMAPLFYERDKGSADKPSIARPATTELGSLAVSYMNLASAADFDAWDAASSLTFLIGVDPGTFNTALDKLKEGSRWIPLPGVANSNKNPEVRDGSMGAVTGDIFDKRLAAKREEAAHMAALEASSAPSATGVSKAAGFIEVKAPRLALMASELETCQNAILRFLELRFGNVGDGQPRAVVRWPRQFDVGNIGQEVESFFAMERLAGLRSPKAEVQMMMRYMQEKGLLTKDADEITVKKELTAFAEAIAKAMEEGKLDVFTGKGAQVVSGAGAVGSNFRTGSRA